MRWVLGKLSVPGRPTIWITVGQGPTALAVGAGGGCLDILLSSILSPLSTPLWEMVRYRLKYCLKAPFNPKQSTNHFDPWQVVPRQVFTAYSRLLISTAFVVVSRTGCLGVTGVRLVNFK